MNFFIVVLFCKFALRISMKCSSRYYANTAKNRGFYRAGAQSVRATAVGVLAKL